MGWDLYIEGRIDDECVPLGDWNYTHNCNGMIREAGFIGWNHERLSKGISAKNLGEELADVIVEMRKNPEKYQKMNPDNGWGNYESLLRVLEEITAKCIRFPSATVTVGF